VYEVDSGETTSVCSSDVPWLSEAPVSGNLAAGASQIIDVTMDSTGLTGPHTYHAQLKIKHDTPYTVPNVPVDMGVYPPVVATEATVGPVAGMAPLTVPFTGSATGGNGVYTYDWNFGDGTAHSPAQNPSHTYYAGGSYTVTFTATDGLGSSGTDSHLVINVTQPAVPLLVNAYDDNKRSQFCVNTITGEYQWYIYKGVGAGSTYTGTLQVLNGRTLFKSFPADPQGILYATYDPYNSRARGYHSLGTVYSALADSNTKNNPACGSGGPTPPTSPK